LVKDRNPKELLLVLTNSKYYSTWECSEITDLQLCRLSRQWGNTEYWGDEIDIGSHMLGDALFLDAEGVKGLEELMTTTWEKVRPKKPLSPLPTPPAVEVRLNALQFRLKAASEVLVARELEFNRVSFELHLAKGGTRETFVPPHPQSYINMGGGGPPAPTAMDPVASHQPHHQRFFHSNGGGSGGESGGDSHGESVHWWFIEFELVCSHNNQCCGPVDRVEASELPPCGTD
jgi:hypothetical protein